jgi:hypothetical protein
VPPGAFILRQQGHRRLAKEKAARRSRGPGGGCARASPAPKRLNPLGHPLSCIHTHADPPDLCYEACQERLGGREGLPAAGERQPPPYSAGAPRAPPQPGRYRPSGGARRCSSPSELEGLGWEAGAAAVGGRRGAGRISLRPAGSPAAPATPPTQLLHAQSSLSNFTPQHPAPRRAPFPGHPRQARRALELHAQAAQAPAHKAARGRAPAGRGPRRGLHLWRGGDGVPSYPGDVCSGARAAPRPGARWARPGAYEAGTGSVQWPSARPAAAGVVGGQRLKTRPLSVLRWTVSRRLFRPLPAQGNVILTNHKYEVLTLLRSHRCEVHRGKRSGAPPGARVPRTRRCVWFSQPTAALQRGSLLASPLHPPRPPICAPLPSPAPFLSSQGRRQGPRHHGAPPLPHDARAPAPEAAARPGAAGPRGCGDAAERRGHWRRGAYPYGRAAQPPYPRGAEAPAPLRPRRPSIPFDRSSRRSPTPPAPRLTAPAPRSRTPPRRAARKRAAAAGRARRAAAAAAAAA